jgi:transposase
MSDAVFIGIDVSRDTLEIGSSAQTSTSQQTNDIAGIEALTAQVLAFGPTLVVPGGHRRL